MRIMRIMRRCSDMGTWRHGDIVQHLWHVCQCPRPVCTEHSAVYRIAPYTIQMWIYWDRTSSATQQQSTIFCLCILCIIRLQVSDLQAGQAVACPGFDMQSSIVLAAAELTVECGDTRMCQYNFPVSGQSQGTCFYPVNMNIVTAFFSQMYNT